MKIGKLALFAFFATTLPFTSHAGGETVMPGGGTEMSTFDDLGPPRLAFDTARRRPNAPTTEITEALVREIVRGAQFCSQLPRIEYSLDCLSDRMAFTARLVPRIKAYSELRVALVDAAKETRSLARQSRSKDLPTGSLQLRSDRTRPLVPFETAKRPLVEDRTAEIVSTASSRMWSVAAQSPAIRSHYEAFAPAIETYFIFPSFQTPTQG